MTISMVEMRRIGKNSMFLEGMRSRCMGESLELHNLEELNLAKTCLKKLPPGIGALTGLENLNLSNNNFEGCCRRK